MVMDFSLKPFLTSIILYQRSFQSRDVYIKHLVYRSKREREK